MTGLSGAGKTTVGSLLYQHLKAKKDNVVFLDGDALRRVMNDFDYTETGREQASYRNMRLFQLLTSQGIDVVCCVIGMKEEYRAWNRANIPNYREIYLKVTLEELVRRDPKGLYHKALHGEIQHVYGVDLPFEEPVQPDVVVENQGPMRATDALARIIAALNL